MNITQLPVRSDGSGVAVRTSGLTKRYGDRTVVDNLSITVPSGTVCGFIGRNGAGKTTTIRMLLGLIRPGSGTAEVLGHSIHDPRAYLPRVGAMIEGPAFYPTLTARKNLEALRLLGSLPASSIDRSLEIVGLADRADEPVKGFSLGMRQRLGIAAALLPEPSLLILDEPTNGLDPQGIRETRLLLRALADQGMTVLVSSHLLDELQHISDHLVLINQGRLAFEGNADSLMQRAESEMVARADTADGTERLASLLRMTQTNVAVIDGSLRIDFDGSLTAAALNRIAHGHGIVLEHLSIERPRLEDIFFSMTNADQPTNDINTENGALAS
jgi:ABC-2 type transport system ATP-binding protein